MTPPTQDDLAAQGRELDAEVATKVLRLRAYRKWPDVDYDSWYVVPTTAGTVPHWDEVEMPAYSTDIGAAWQIVEWAEASPRGWKLTLMRSGRSLPDYQWICTFHRGHVELARVVERDAPLAICKAALVAVSA